MSKVFYYIAVVLLIGCSAKKNTKITPPTINVKNTSKSSIDQDTARDSKALYHYIIGQLSFNQDKKKEAFKNFQEACKFFETTPPLVRLKMAELQFEEGNSEEALQEVTTALSQNPDDEQTLLLYADILESLSRTDEAAAVYEKVIAMNPRRPEAYLALSSIYSQKQEYGKTHRIVDKFIAEYPDLAVGYQYAARVYELKNDLKSAEAQIAKAYEKEPDNISVMFDKIRILVKQKKVKEAKAVCFQLIEKNPTNIDARRILSHLLINESKLDAALEQLKLIEPEEEDSSDTNYKIALILLEKKDYKAAEDELKKVVSRQPNHGFARFYLATIQSSAGKKDEALENLDAVQKEHEMYVKAKIFSAQIEYERGNKEASFLILEKLISLRPEDLSIVQLYAALLRDNQQYQKAIDLLKNKIQQNPEAEKLYVELAACYEKTNDSQNALISMEQALKIDDSNPDVLNFVAYSYSEKEYQLDLAEKYALKAVKLRPSNSYYLDTLAWVYFKQKRYKDAEQKQLLAISIVKTDPTLLEHLGDIKAALGDSQAAINAYGEALKYITASSGKNSKTPTPAERRQIEILNGKINVLNQKK